MYIYCQYKYGRREREEDLHQYKDGRRACAPTEAVSDFISHTKCF